MVGVKRRSIFTGFLIFVIINATILVTINANPSFNNNNSLNLSQSNELVTREKINVNGNNGFNEFPGTGIVSDPYVISNFEIISPVSNDYDLIVIEDTTAHFIIENNYLSGENHNTGFGIALRNAQNGLIRNNTIVKNTHSHIEIANSVNIIIESNIVTDSGGHGILLSEANNNTIRHNTISLSGGDGIASYFSINNIIENNTLSLNGLNGIRIEISDFHLVNQNTITQNVEGGLYIGSGVGNNVISNWISGNPTGIGFSKEEFSDPSSMNKISNNIISNNQQGILIGQSNENTISHNLIEGNEFDGITVDASNNNNFSENNFFNNGRGILSSGGSTNNIINCNLFEDNDDYGTYIEVNSEFELVSENDFIDNQLIPQAADNGFANLFEKNFWSDLGDLDFNGDGINDIEYMIDGSGGNVDNTSSPIRNSDPNSNISICRVGLLVILDTIVAPLPTTIITDDLLQPKLVLPITEPFLLIFFGAASITIIISLFYLRKSNIHSIKEKST
ncbi:MAG: hypothetical protein HeimC2_18520 [Candidatus Heimdallarchaeota archaeon LC_2]|nr:MAG: hypothetical protein HeimC2_18520 [Candidatus Heimdallarchaeota archaeon LC_2]